MSAKFEQAKKLILAGMCMEEVAKKIEGSEYHGGMDVVILEPGMWHANNRNSEVTEVTGEFDSGEEAAQDYVDTWDWWTIESTTWITVAAWREGIDDECDMVRVDEMDHTISIDPDEPACEEGEHDWKSEYDVVGGCKENPGVWGHGGGAIIWEACAKCGCGRCTDTWAQNPENGVQGLESVSYEVGKYAVSEEGE